MTVSRQPRSRIGLTVAGAVVIAGGAGVAVVEWLRLPKGSVWVVVAITVALVALVRGVTRSR